MARLESRTGASPLDGATATVGRHNHRTVVWLGGEHDVSTTAMVNAALGRATRVDDADVVVDLSAVRFMSAATVGSILRVRRILRGQARALTLRSPSPAAKRFLDVCRLDVLVDATPTLAAAVEPTSALGTWVDVPVRDRERTGASDPEPREACPLADDNRLVIESVERRERRLAIARQVDGAIRQRDGR